MPNRKTSDRADRAGHETGNLRCGRLVRVVGIASINEAGPAAVVQQLFRLLDCPADGTTRLAGLDLAFDFNQGSVGGVETPREEHCDVEQGRRIISEQACRVGDVELRGL
jgi:hypothetical protein